LASDAFRPPIADLLAAARGADPQAFDRLFARFRNYLRLLAQDWLEGAFRGKADPSDLVQETLLEAHQGFAAFQGTDEPEFVAWLRQIMARNVADFVRRYRSAARNVRREEPSPDSRIVARLQLLAGKLQSSPSHGAHRREMGVVLADAMAELLPPHREVIRLRNLQGLGWPEIAQRMNRSEDAARKLWTRALVNLKPLIESRL
jgi:RNA polymerase sigma-70 factor, ECF subfamily